MGLLAPWLLLLGLAVAVPVLLHLMHRRPGPRLDFPALRYLRRAERESGRRVRVRQLLLLALRIAAVLLLALAAARPFLRAGADAHPPTDVVLVLDNSMSTGAVVEDERVFDALRDAARASLSAAGPDDRFWLIRAAEPWQPAVVGDRARVGAALEAVEPVDAHADLRAALRRARSLLAAAAADRPGEIHLLSDLQASAFASDTVAGNGGDGGFPVVVYGPPLATPANHGVGTLQVAGGLAPRVGEQAALSAEVVGTSTDSVTLRLWIDERPVAAALAAPGEAAVFTLPARTGGTVVGRLEAEPDALRADDRRHFAYAVAPPVAVAAGASPPFIAEALGALAAANRIRLVAGAGAQVLVADAAAVAATQSAADALVLLPPDSAVLLPAANAALARLGVGLRLEPDVGRGSVAIVAGDDASAALRDARVARAYRIVTAPGAAGTDTLLRLADGRPWLVAARATTGQRVLLLASPLTPEASSVPASAAMIPLLDRLTGEWAGVAGTGTASLEPGTVVQLPGRAAALADPADSIVAVEGGAPWRLPPRAGVYRALASADPGAEVLASYVVAPSTAESRLERIDVDDVDEALGGDVAVVDGARDDWGDAIFVERIGAEWWRLLLVVAILALLVETLVASTRRPAATVTAPAVPAAATPASTDSGID